MPSGGLQIGTLSAFLLHLRSLFDPVPQLSELYRIFQSATAGAERVGTVLSVEPTVREGAEPLQLPAVRGEVRLDGVHFGYPCGDGALFGGLPLQHLAAPPAR